VVEVLKGLDAGLLPTDVRLVLGVARRRLSEGLAQKKLST
jgi:hypothetical protein